MSLRAAINGKCRDCIHDPDAAGSAAVQVELCACFDCPLWTVRPVRPVAVRGPYSAPVCEEQGLSPALAAFRLAHPFTRPPESLDSHDSRESTEADGEDGGLGTVGALAGAES